MSCSQSTPTAKRRKLDLSAEIVVLIGAAEQRFTVPKCLLTMTSQFFKACCNERWSEGQTKTVKLPETGAESFSTYLQWIYTNKIVLADDNNDGAHRMPYEDITARENVAKERYDSLIDLAALSDSLGDAAFGNFVTDAFESTRQFTLVLVGAEQMQAIWTKLPTTHTLRRWAVDTIHANTSESVTEWIARDFDRIS